MALCYAPLALAQNTEPKQQPQNDNSFTFTEAQLDEDANSYQGVTILNSNTNTYASEVGYLFSPLRFRYRALHQKYNEIYINGAPVNDVERGLFGYSSIGGLNQISRNVDFTLPFETGNFGMSGLAGSNNYDFRPGNQRIGHRFSLGVANRNYTLRGMYTYSSGFNKKGWAVSANLTYRWADQGYVEGTFYNSLSYYLGVEKLLGANHSLSFATWGNPTERASQGASTAESFWLANSYQYNPYWGYQNGKKRNSRVVNDFAPTAALTWDWKINQDMKLTTTLLGKYAQYKSTKLNYNNSDNPAPDYWKALPSTFFDVFHTAANEKLRSESAYWDWQRSVDYFKYNKGNRQIQWDKLYWANKSANEQGRDAMYYVQARNNNNLYFTLASTLNVRETRNSTWNIGFVAATNKGMHYQTMEDLLGANMFHNINTYAIGTYSPASNAVQYDLNHPNAQVKVGDKFAYDYDIVTNKAYVWANYAATLNRLHLSASGKIGGTNMQRDGKMRNGLFANNSYGKSGTAGFLDGGAKVAASYDAGRGHVFSLASGYQWNAPTPNVAFAAPEMNNDFVQNLKNEKILSAEAGYQYSGSWLHANLTGYFAQVDDATEWTNFYFDDINSFSYNSITGLQKRYYGVELGMVFKLFSWLDLKAIGTWSDALNTSDADVIYLNSTQGTYISDRALIKNMRESGTPLTAGSLSLDYHNKGWYVTLSGNYYDRIFLSYAPYYRYKNNVTNVREDGTYDIMAQQRGRGGFMMDGSVGKSIRIKGGGMLSFNLMVTNILNNQKIVTGGYEQSRNDLTTSGNSRGYLFSMNPKLYHAYGTNGMFQVSYRF